MQINRSTDYAIRMILYLAQVTQPIPSSKLAEAIGVSSRYLMQIAARLRDAGLITVLRGSNGGYVLSEDPESITLLDLIRMMEFRPYFHCKSSVSSQYNSIALDRAYEQINHVLIDALHSITIGSLLTGTSVQ